MYYALNLDALNKYKPRCIYRYSSSAKPGLTLSGEFKNKLFTDKVRSRNFVTNPIFLISISLKPDKLYIIFQTYQLFDLTEFIV